VTEPESPDTQPVDESIDPANPYEGATPPGYEDWPTHGGYLGCLMGVVLALVLAPLAYFLFGFMGSALFKPLSYGGVWLAGLLTFVVYLACFVALARLGWRLGKHFYREYETTATTHASMGANQDTSDSSIEAAGASGNPASGTSVAQGQ